MDDSARLLVADEEGQILEWPGLALAGQSGDRWGPVPDEELVPVPEGTKVFFLPETQAVGWDPDAGRPRVLWRYRAVAAMLQAGYTRTRLPAVAYPRGRSPDYGCHRYLPLWAYAAVGWKDGRMVAAAFRVDPMTHSETRHYDDRQIAPRVEARLRREGRNRLLRHLGRCALEYHCFAAKNLFMERWEAPLPTAPSCNARCVGCISLQPADCCPASQERIRFVPSVQELVEVAVPHLERVDRGIVSFGQGCEGEPLTVAPRIEEAVRAFRDRTDRGTVHLNTNGSRPEALRALARAGLDSVRISLNSAVAETYYAYYRPRRFRFDQVREAVGTAVDAGLYTALNLLVFPGVSDLPEEVEALEGLIDETGLHMVHLRNLSLDPRLYLDHLPPRLRRRDDGIGLLGLARRLKQRFPRLELGYFNRPRECFDRPLVDQLPWAREALAGAITITPEDKQALSLPARRGKGPVGEPGAAP
ncbi:radical SAM protein [Deferrisoma camini]|uniref:radical SAM protein n=1 Tax=Deferrisoma camini TaxID=1035120 RepID=UPI00046D549C|nr:radical SAM protein [Deferrisoma camini]